MWVCSNRGLRIYEPGDALRRKYLVTKNGCYCLGETVTTHPRTAPTAMHSLLDPRGPDRSCNLLDNSRLYRDSFRRTIGNGYTKGPYNLYASAYCEGRLSHPRNGHARAACSDHHRTCVVVDFERLMSPSLSVLLQKCSVVF
jgi:hypothetical protein